MTDKEFNTKLFEAIYACYKKLEEYKKLQNASEEAKLDAAALHQYILSVLTLKSAKPPTEINDTNLESIKTLFVESEFASKYLEDITSEVINRLELFGIVHDPSIVANAGIFLTSTVPGIIPETISGAANTAVATASSVISYFTPQSVKTVVSKATSYLPETPTLPPAALASGLTDEIAHLKAVQQELLRHIVAVGLITEPEPAKQTVKPFLTNENKDSDASRLITMVALTHVDESFRYRFASLFEYAYCLEQIRDKLPTDVGNRETHDILKAVLGQHLKELGITQAELATINSNDELYKQKEQDYVMAKMPQDDCLDLEEYFLSQDRQRMNMEMLFSVLDKQGDIALLTSFKQSHAASEKNDQLGRVMMRSIRYLRDQAKAIKQDFDSPLLKLPGGTTISLDKVLSKFGIRKFIRSNFKEFSYKEHSDLMRVRSTLAAAKPFTAHKITENALPEFAFEVKLGDRPDFSYAMQTYQQANLAKYAAICSQQMQLAHILLTTITTQDPKLLADIQKLQEAFTKIYGPATKKPFQYREAQHRKLHEALNNICTAFYPQIEQIPMQLLIQAGNIQRKFDYNMYANDAGNLLITNSGAYSYGKTYNAINTTSSTSANVFNRTTGGIEWSTYDFAASVGHNATRLFRGNNAETIADIKFLHHSAAVLQESFRKEDNIDGPIQKRDKDLFKFCAKLKRTSFLQRLMSFIINFITVIGAFLANLIAKIMRRPKKPSKDPNRYRTNLHKQLMSVQLEQQAVVLIKSLQIANAMQIENRNVIYQFCRQNFDSIGTADNLKLNKKAKAYYKFLAVQEAVKSVADPVIRDEITVALRNISSTAPDSMDLQTRQDYVAAAIKILAPYGDYVKIDAFFAHCKEQFDEEIGEEIDKANLKSHRITARETINWLLSAPGSFESTKAVFMLSSFINHVLHRLKTHFIFSLLVSAHRVQKMLHSTSMITEKSKELEIPGSVKKAAEYYVYEHGKLRLDLKCADRVIALLKAEQAILGTPLTPPSTATLLVSSLFTKPKPTFAATSYAKSNPYNRNKTTLVANLQERAAWQLVEVIESTLAFTAKIHGNNAVDGISVQLRQCLEKLQSSKAKENDIVRNRIIIKTLPLIAKLYENYDLQKDSNTFEFLMLLRFAAESVGSMASKTISVQELMSYHGIPDVPASEGGKLQAILNTLNIGSYIYQTIVDLANSTSIDAMNSALSMLPKQDINFNVVVPKPPVKKKKSSLPRLPKNVPSIHKPWGRHRRS